MATLRRISICCSLWLPAWTVATVVWRPREADESCSVACGRAALDCDDAALRRLAVADGQRLQVIPALADDVARSCDQRGLVRSLRTPPVATTPRTCPCRRPGQRRLDDEYERHLLSGETDQGDGEVDGGSIVGGIFFVSIPCAFFIWLYRQMRKRPPPGPAIPQIIADGFPTVQTGAIAGPQGPGGPMVAIGRPVVNSGPPHQAVPAGTVVPPHVPSRAPQLSYTPHDPSRNDSQPAAGANAALGSAFTSGGRPGQATAVATQPSPNAASVREDNAEDNQNLQWTGDEAPATWTCASCRSTQSTSSQFCGECGAARVIATSR